jgi:hypothetical protein
MFLLIYGRGGEKLSEELKAYYSYRGTACYEYDFMSNLDDMVETLGIHLGSESMTPELLSRLRGSIYDATKAIIVKNVTDSVQSVTARWEELNLHFTAVIRNIQPDADLGLFPSYKIFMMEEESHFESSDLHACAVSNNFDLVVDTLTHDPREVAALIGESLHRKMMSAFTKPQDGDKTVP